MASYHNSRTTQLVGCFSLSFVDLVDVEVDLCCMSVDVVVVWVFCSLDLDWCGDGVEVTDVWLVLGNVVLGTPCTYCMYDLVSHATSAL